MAIPKAYTPEEVAAAAHVTRRTVYNWIKSGHLTAIKAGPARLLIPESALRKLLTGRDAESSVPAPKLETESEHKPDKPKTPKTRRTGDRYEADGYLIEVIDDEPQKPENPLFKTLPPMAVVKPKKKLRRG